jgi:poly-gamma-glutamate synthesis protein (capsule biosynthesis protein)
MSIEWDVGAWKRNAGQVAPEYRVILAGDWTSKRGDERIVAHESGTVYGDVLPILQDADFRIVNLESPLSDSGAPIAKDGPNLRGRRDAVAGLTVVPFNVACLANNHIMDFGAEALDDTLRALHTCGIQTVGAGLSRSSAYSPLIVDLDGLRLGIVNFCVGEDGTAAIDEPGVFGWELGMVVKSIGELRECVDVVIVIAHAGREYVPVPPPYIQRVFRTLSESGADVVVGHHPHVPQGIEVYKGVPLVYSLGNFVFFQKGGPVFRRYGFLLSLELTGGTVSGCSLVPYALKEEGSHQVTGRECEWLYRELRIVSEILVDPQRVREVWHAYIDSFGEAFWQHRNYRGVAAWLVARMKGDYVRVAATLRNRFLTPAHHHFMADGLGRLGAGRLGESEAWAKELVNRWRTLEHPDAEQ